MTRNRRALAAGVLLSALVLTGCGGAGDSGASSSGAAAAADSGVQPQPAGEKGAAPSAGGDASGGSDVQSQAAPVVTDQKVIKNAAMTVQAPDVNRAAAAVRTAVEQAKGFIADEKTSTTPQDPTATQDGARKGYTESVLTARVPNDSLDVVMAQVGRTGTVLSRSQTSQDVTSHYVDTSSRVRTQTASVERIRALLAQATTIGQVVQIEGELSRREADLESLQAQLKALQNQTTLSTLTVDLTPVEMATPPKKGGSHGFLAGLSAGWTALVASLTVLLTAVGAMLPFLVLLALVGVPLLVWLRRQRRAAAGDSTPSSTPSPPQPQPQPAP